ncbi:hypothetical protein JZ751_001999 [Albula glossodonta]|uniref:Receptor ligand binding region domain-containing protein n=1 Tax=Albula glossodonta TaxID=121402 RepID=A0A8T2P6U3_9TELE|nr:hypothetical protein JZ751_001999 [Albula glossodonta]
MRGTLSPYPSTCPAVFSGARFTLSSALLYDAVHTVVAAVQELNRSQNVGAMQLSCKSSKIWEHGTSLMNYLRMVGLPLLHTLLHGYWLTCTPGAWPLRQTEILRAIHKRCHHRFYSDRA